MCVADFAFWTLIGSRPDDTFYHACWSRIWESTAGSWQSIDERCVLCLPSLALWTVCWDAYITYERICRLRQTHTKFHWAFWLGWLRSESEVTSPRISREQRMYTDYFDQFSMNMNWTWRFLASFVLLLDPALTPSPSRCRKSAILRCWLVLLLYADLQVRINGEVRNQGRGD